MDIRAFRARLGDMERAVTLLQGHVRAWRECICDLERTLAEIAAQWPEETE